MNKPLMPDWMFERNYILNGKIPEPVTTQEQYMKSWGQCVHVGDDTIHDIRISTVFLTLDHQHGDGPPVLFETMIFGGEHDQDCWRYVTWDEAEKGHAEAVALVRASIDAKQDRTRKLIGRQV